MPSPLTYPKIKVVLRSGEDHFAPHGIEERTFDPEKHQLLDEFEAEQAALKSPPKDDPPKDDPPKVAPKTTPKKGKEK